MSLVLNVKCKECRGEDFFKIETRVSAERIRIEDDGRNVHDQFQGFAYSNDEELKRVKGALPTFDNEYICATCGATYSHADLHPQRQETSIS